MIGRFFSAACVLLGVLLSNASALEIVVSPLVLIVKSPGQVVTIHTDVSYKAVTDCSLSVDDQGLEINTFYDNRGNLVVQCSRSDVVAALDPKATAASFTLTVTTANGDDSATRTIPVKR
jgi:hypothetical protein